MGSGCKKGDGLGVDHIMGEAFVIYSPDRASSDLLFLPVSLGDGHLALQSQAGPSVCGLVGRKHLLLPLSSGGFQAELQSQAAPCGQSPAAGKYMAGEAGALKAKNPNEALLLIAFISTYSLKKAIAACMGPFQLPLKGSSRLLSATMDDGILPAVLSVNDMMTMIFLLHCR